MPRREHYVPKHAGPRRVRPPKRGLRAALVASGVAAAATGLAVSTGVALTGRGTTDTASAALASRQVQGSGSSAGYDRADTTDPAVRGDRVRSVSRSVDRSAVDATKKRALDQTSGGQVTETEDLSSQDPRTIAKALLAQYGFGEDQFSCLDSIYNNESGWNVHADNPTSSAYGIPQALPGSKMATAGPNWENDPVTQIKWGLGYIKGRYGSPCSAWSFKQGAGWY